jgi:predicted dehydrogenase
MKNYGVAILGAGNVAKGHLKAISDTEGAELVAIGGRDHDRTLTWANEQGVSCKIYTQLAELLADDRVEIVIITTPNYQHAKQTVKAAQAGKHILIEKPVALNREDLHAMQQAVKRAGVRTLVSFVLHWNPSIRMSKHLIQQGAIGNLFMVETCYWHSTPRAVPGHWMTRKETAGSVFLMGGCHAVDAARWLVGEDIIEVSAYATEGAKPWMEYPDTVTAAVRFNNGIIGRISASMGCVMPYAFEVTLMGDKGSIRDNRIYSHLFPYQDDYAKIPTQLPDSGSVHHHPFSPGMEHFLKCIEEGRETEVSLLDSINVHEACIAVDQSAEEGHPVSLPLTR